MAGRVYNMTVASPRIYSTVIQHLRGPYMVQALAISHGQGHEGFKTRSEARTLKETDVTHRIVIEQYSAPPGRGVCTAIPCSQP